MRSRRLAAILCVGVLAGIGLGLAFGRGGTDDASAKGPPGVLSRGTFKTVSWSTTGSATVERTSSGHLVLRFSRDFRTQRAPELWVHIGSIRIPLKRAWGAQTYALPESADLRQPVEVFCEKCNKAWGEVTLKAVPHRID
jgi:hypothetical protein